MGWKHGKDSKEVKTPKTLQNIVLILILVFLCAGCSSGAYVRQGNRNDSEGSNLSGMEGNRSNRPPILHMGSKFIYQDTSLSDGRACSVTMEVKEKKEFEHKAAYWIEVVREGESYFDIYDMNLNWIGLFGDGRELEMVEPSLQIFRWPLRVGEKWRSGYTLRDFSDHSHGVYLHDSKIGVNIRTYEEVRVPAGAFKALRIQAGDETIWYAPSVGWIVKEELNLNGKNRWVLEMVKYTIPGSM